MNDLKNNEIRVTVTTMVDGEHYESMDVFAEYGADIPQETRSEDVMAIMSLAAAATFRDSGAPIHVAETIIRCALTTAYAKEDTNA